MSSPSLSPYGRTPINRTGYLDILSPRPVPINKEDILFEITSEYTYRPDLLAHIVYGRKELWWVFAQRNLDILKDPVFDLVPGIKIYLPKQNELQKFLGY